MQIPITRLDPEAILPHQAHDDDAGYDLCANVDITIAPARWAAIPTGLALALPPGSEGQVRPRSGLAAQHGVTVLNAPGLIDAQYRGELKVLLVNTDPDTAYEVHRGERIGQLVIQAVTYVEWHPVDALDDTTRDTFGFGSSGR